MGVRHNGSAELAYDARRVLPPPCFAGCRRSYRDPVPVVPFVPGPGSSGVGAQVSAGGQGVAAGARIVPMHGEVGRRSSSWRPVASRRRESAMPRTRSAWNWCSRTCVLHGSFSRLPDCGWCQGTPCALFFYWRASCPTSLRCVAPQPASGPLASRPGCRECESWVTPAIA